MMNWKGTLCFLVVLVMLIYALIYNRKMKTAFKENRVRIGDINSQIEDSLAGIRVVKSFGNEKREIEKFKKGNERFVEAKVYHIVIWQDIMPEWMHLLL